MAQTDAWERFQGQVIIVDTDSSLIYLGTLQSLTGEFVVLANVDVHDRREGPSTKEQYVIDARRNGVHVNRKEVSIRREQVISLSKLDDVILY